MRSDIKYFWLLPSRFSYWSSLSPNALNGRNNGGVVLTRGMLIAVLLLCACGWADEVYTKNAKANRLYEKGKYEEALKLYDDALLGSPGDKKLSANKGSALYKMGQYEGAQQSYDAASSTEDKRARADVLYNRGNALFRQGQELEAGGNPAAMEKYKAAYEDYVGALKQRPKDMDAKWNLQLAYQRIKQMQNQQNQSNQDQQNKQNRQQDQNKHGQKNQQDEKNQDKKQQEQQQQDENQKQQQTRNEDSEKDQKEQRQQPQPRRQESDMEKKEAQRLIMQYADDANDLNKPKKKAQAVAAGTPEKDW